MGETYGEDFNRKEAKKVLERWYADTSKREDTPWWTDRVFDKDVDDLINVKNHEVASQRFQSQVQRLMNLGLNEKEIGDALDKGIGNLAQEYKDKTGSFSTKSSRDPQNVLTSIISNIQSSHKGGRSDEELNSVLKNFDAYLNKDMSKMFKDMDFSKRAELEEFIKSNKSNKKEIRSQAIAKLKDSTDFNETQLLKDLTGMDTNNPQEIDLAIAGLNMIWPDQEFTSQEKADYIRNFGTTSVSEQEELKVSGPPAATEDEGTGTTGSGASQTSTVYEQDRDGNWITGEKDTWGNWTSPPTIIGDDKALAAIARTDAKAKEALERADSIYARNRADNRADYEEDRGFQRRDAVTKRTQDLADIQSMYGRQDETYARDRGDTIADRAEDRGFQTADRDALWGREDTLISNANRREDLIRVGQWTRDDEVAYRNRDWNLQDRRDDRIWDEAQQAEDRTFKTGQLAMQMGPQYFQSQLDAAEFERDVLRNASDYIAAAFMQRGEASPFKAVTQADLINGFRAKARDMMEATEAGFRPDIGNPVEVAKDVVTAASGEPPGGAAQNFLDSMNPPAGDSNNKGKSSSSASSDNGNNNNQNNGNQSSSANTNANANNQSNSNSSTNTGPTGSYYDNTDTGPLVQPFEYGKDSPARRNVPREITEYERATAPSFRSPPVGSEFGAGMGSFIPPENRDYAGIGREIGASPFEPINRSGNMPLPAGPPVGSEFGDDAFVPPNMRGPLEDYGNNQNPSNQYPGNRPPPEYGMDPWNIRSQGWQPLWPDSGSSGQGPAQPSENYVPWPRGGEDSGFGPRPPRRELPWERPPQGSDPRFPDDSMPPRGIDPRFPDDSMAPPYSPEGIPPWSEEGYWGQWRPENPAQPPQSQVFGMPPSAGLPPTMENEFGDANFTPPQTMRPRGPAQEFSGVQNVIPQENEFGAVGFTPPQTMRPRVVPQENEFGAVNFTPPQARTPTPQVPNEISSYEEQTRFPTQYDDEVGYLGDVSSPAAEYQLPRMGMGPGTPPQTMQLDNYGRLMDYGSAGGQEDMLDPSYGGIDSFATQYPQTYQPPSRMSQIMGSTPQPVQDFSEGFEFEQVDQWPQNQYSPQYNTGNVVPQPVQDFSEGFEFEQVNQWPVNTSTPSFNTSNVIPRAVPDFSEGFDFERVEQFPVTPSSGVNRMSEIMQAAPVARATGQRARYGTQPISRPPSVGFRPPEFEY